MASGVARRLRARDRERGAAAVEFALVAPILLLLVFGIISYGYMLSFRQALSQGAAEGVRKAAISLPSTANGTKISDAVNAVNDALGSYGVTCAAAPPSLTSTSASGNLVKDSTAVGTCSVAIAQCPTATAYKCATVTLDHAYRDHPLLPSVPGLGLVLPSSLKYAAVAEVS